MPAAPGGHHLRHPGRDRAPCRASSDPHALSDTEHPRKAGLLTKAEHGKTTRAYRSEQVVFAQGDEADAVFFIQSGKVKLTVVSSHGKEAVIGVLDRRSFFGEGCLAAQPLRVATSSAIAPSCLIRVDRKSMVELLHAEPEFAESFTAYLLSRNVRIEEDLVDQLFNSSEKRLAPRRASGGWSDGADRRRSPPRCVRAHGPAASDIVQPRERRIP